MGSSHGGKTSAPILLVDIESTVTGLDLHFLPMAENKGSHQFLNWWQQVSTGYLHLDGFESAPLTK